MKNETLKFNTAHGEATAYAAIPDNPNGKGVIVVQEYWGLNDHIKDIANRYAAEGFTAIAPDLYRGRATKDKEEAAKLMKNLEIEDGLNTIESALEKARETYDVQKFGITGFCMGGTYAMHAACKLEGLSAAAAFYGDFPEEEVLKNLKMPVLFISAKKDGWINPEKIRELERIADENFLPIDSVKYEADHAFFNDTRPEVYDREAAEDAWAKVIDFFNTNLETVSVQLNEIHPDNEP
ncbi:MAG: dienelactone hydrolase family protein [Pyrinomonadaceae bacterium]